MEAVFSGRVQGVGFRYGTLREARDFAVRGYVRNLPDGRVELVAEGSGVELRKFLDRVKAVFRGNVKDVQRGFGPATGEFDDFRITY